MEDVLVGALAVVLLLGLPALLCWTAAVLAARAIRDLPVSKSVVGEVLLIGFQLSILWIVIAAPIGLAAIVFVIISVFAAGPAVWDGPPVLATSIAMGVMLLVVTWICFRPILAEEWQRLTG